MNEENKPKECNCEDCKNKAYKKNYLTTFAYEWVCRKHYKEFS